VITISPTSFIVVWQIDFPNNTNDKIIGRIWNITKAGILPIDDEFEISGGNQSSQLPSLANLPEDDAFAVVWQTFNKTAKIYDVWIYVYDPILNASFSESLNFTSSVPPFPVVTPLSQNVIVTAWLVHFSFFSLLSYMLFLFQYCTTIYCYFCF
jgi:membrane associated rhomboid family serine protease